MSHTPFIPKNNGEFREYWTHTSVRVRMWETRRQKPKRFAPSRTYLLARYRRIDNVTFEP